MDVSDPGVECEAHECAENGIVRVICRSIGTQGPKGGLSAAELAILEVVTGQETCLDTPSF